jgi:uncharacterized protein YbcI
MSTDQSTQEPSEKAARQSEEGASMAAISRRMVALLKEFAGKGPTEARTYYWGDLVVVLLSGGYTAVEKTLIDAGKPETVADQREALQEVLRPRMKQIIEEELRRQVVAFMSTTHQGPDLNAELFVLSS